MALRRTSNAARTEGRRPRALRLTARTAFLSCVALAAGMLPATGAIGVAGTTAAAAPQTQGRLFTSPESQLGKSWQDSTDRAVTGTGDSAGFHILVADEADSFAYREIANLTQAGLNGIGPWTGYTCTTGSGRYAAAVYAPSTAANKPSLMQHGAFAAVVDLTSGKVTRSVTGVQLAYFSPGCGESDTVTFTRSAVGDSREGTTKVFDVDAASGRTLRTTTVKGQFTNPMPTADGDLGVIDGRLVRLATAGKSQGTSDTVAALPGRLFALAPSEGGAIDLALVAHGKDELHRLDSRSGKLTRLGSAPLGKLGLFPRGDGDLVAGAVSGVDTAKAPGLHKADAPDKPVAASRQGHLLTTSVASDELKGITSAIGSPSGSGAGRIHVAVLATATNTPASTDVVTAEATVTEAADDVERETGPNLELEKDELAYTGLVPDEPNTGSHYSNCLVKRNDPHGQALQPSTNMVEWAVDQAVHGDLTVTRPANYLGTGSVAYTPNGLFPRVALTGGGTVPAQVMLGILAQESNFKQASWHSVPGDGGNPLLGDYFGNTDSIHYYPNGAVADCGYGIAQVTSGMNEAKPNPYNPTEAYAIATDYASNIAAGVQILSKTWNQLKSLGMNVNTGNSTYVENWYMALWGYNSGVYTDSSQNGGRTGLGWYNNPANPNYPSDRAPFLRDSYDDAAHPANWPYEEKIMGWAETPQRTYDAEPSYALPLFPTGGVGVSGKLNLNTNYRSYCTQGTNSCDPGASSGSDPCPAEDESCWWNGSVSWGGGMDDTTGSKENLVYALGSGEPALDRQYAAGPCNNVGMADGTLLIDDLPVPADNTQGCKDSTTMSGTFKLRLGDNFTMNRSDGTWRATGDIAPIDLHQLGAGYDGHVWFTHAYPNSATHTNYLWHTVTATWTPEASLLPFSGSPGRRYAIYVHLPNHGAQAVVPYTVNVGMNTAGAQPSHTCSVNQASKSNGQDVWAALGTLKLWEGANIQADNTSRSDYTGDADVAYDAVKLVPVSAASTGTCFDE
ncbi:transglycosylase SLT domain-containing protein [Streptomyces sp. NBC_00464]|uniref:hypothetical protein n=1 Tax=Streptomyces sp. NBC_00464 TaxID=2975751 RepID=UPI002E19E953